MPTFEVTSPDGRTFEVTAPEGASQADVLAYAQANYANAAKPEPGILGRVVQAAKDVYSGATMADPNALRDKSVLDTAAPAAQPTPETGAPLSLGAGPVRADWAAKTSKDIAALPLDAQAQIAQSNTPQAAIAKRAIPQTVDKMQRTLDADTTPYDLDTAVQNASAPVPDAVPTADAWQTTKAIGQNVAAALPMLGAMIGKTLQNISAPGAKGNELGANAAAYWSDIEKNWSADESVNYGPLGTPLVKAAKPFALTAPATAAAIVGAPVGAVGAGLGLLMGFSAAQDAKDAVQKSGGSAQDANEAAALQFAINAGSGYALAYLTAGLGTIAKQIAPQPTMAATLQTITDNRIVVPFLKAVGSRLAADPALFAAQNAASSAVNTAYGIPGPSMKDAIADGVTTGVGFALLGAPMAGVGAVRTSRSNNRVAAAFADPSVPPIERLQAVDLAAQVARASGVPAGDVKAWVEQSVESVAQQRAISVPQPKATPASQTSTDATTSGGAPSRAVPPAVLAGKSTAEKLQAIRALRPTAEPDPAITGATTADAAIDAARASVAAATSVPDAVLSAAVRPEPKAPTRAPLFRDADEGVNLLSDAYNRDQLNRLNVRKGTSYATLDDALSAGHEAVPYQLKVADASEVSAAIPAGQRLVSQLVAKAFGKSITYVKDVNGLEIADGFYGGQLQGGDPNRLFLDVKSQYGPLRIVGHEIGHALETQMPTVFGALKAEIAKSVDTSLQAEKYLPTYSHKYAKLLDQQKAGTVNQADFEAQKSQLIKDLWTADPTFHREVISNLIGEHMTKASFWLEMAERLGKQAGSDLLTLANKVTGRAAAAVGNRYLVGAKEAQALVQSHDAVLNAMAQYKAWIDAGQPASGAAGPRADAPQFAQKDFVRAPDLSPDEREVESRFYDRIARDPKGMVDDYLRRFGTVVDPDDAKKLSPEFSANPALAAAVHEPSSTLTKMVYTRLLADHPGEPVLFTAGGGGSGKTESMAFYKTIAQHTGGGIIYDSTLSSFPSAVKRIDEALAGGHEVHIAYTNRPADKAFEFAMQRPRVVPLSEVAAKHVGASDTIRQLAEHYADDPRVKIVVLNNSGHLAEIHVGGLDDVPKYAHTDLERSFYAIANQARAEGRIDEARYQALVRGRGEESRGGVQQPESGQDVGATQRRVGAGEKATVATPQDFTPGRVKDILRKDDWAILTAENPHGVKTPAAENAKRMSDLRATLDAKGLSYEPAVGKYGNEENVLVIYGLHENEAIALGRKFEQESILTNKGIVYQDGTVNPAKGIETYTHQPDDFFTEIPRTGARFAVDIDWDHRVGREQLEPVSADGAHFSKEPRKMLSGGYYGTGLKGEEAERLRSAPAEIRARTNYYVSNGGGVRPEAGVGDQAHYNRLDNLYDADVNPLRLPFRTDPNGAEKGVHDAGYSGYLTRGFGGGQGAAVVLGAEARQTEHVGGAADVNARLAKAPEPAYRYDQLTSQALAAKRALPAGEMDGASWRRLLREVEPEISKGIDWRKVDAAKKYYKDELPLRELPQTEDGPLMFSKKDEESWYYSALARAIDARMPEKVRTGNDAAAWLFSNASKLGVKADEMKWSGVLDYLKLRGKEQISKADIADFLAQNGVKVQEVMLGSSAKEDADRALADFRSAARARGLSAADINDREITLWRGDAAPETPDEARLVAALSARGNADPDGGARPKFEEYVLPGGENYRELLLTLPRNPDIDAGGPAFISSHYGQPNILAHVRFNDRTDADGKRVLFLEELQSDWGQKGKKAGFITPDRENRMREITARLRELAKADEETSPEWDALTAEKDALSRPSTPSGPFVQDTKAWTALALKRMVRYAIDNGYDRVAWTTGDQQADRYDLSKQIDNISWRLRDDFDSKHIDINPLKGTVPDIIVDLRGNIIGGAYEGRPLEDVVGKGIAKKVLESNAGKLSGVDLKMGGEGMRAYYDQIVPQVANDVLKKLGGERVKGVDVDYRTPESESWYEAPTAEDIKTQPGFDITPALREKVRTEGVPLFALKDEEQAPSKFAATGRKVIASAKNFTSALTDDLYAKFAPMSMTTASDRARAAAKDFANSLRVAQWQWAKFDEVLKKDYTEKQLADMWNAADEENLLRSRGEKSDTLGINRLPADQRATVETLHAYGEELMQRARDAGMFQGEGVPYWAPRMAVMIGEDGEFSRPRSISEDVQGGSTGRNLTTSSPNLRQRKYLTAEETEAAMKAKLEDTGKEAQLVRNIRTMPMAMARLERAIAGRELVNQIRDIGARTGMETISKSEGPRFFTLDHPALKTITYEEHWTPVSERELLDHDYQVKGGQVVRPDPNQVAGYLPAKSYRVAPDGGIERRDMVPQKTPLYVSKEFEGPLKAVLSEASGPVYGAFMTLKAKTMGVIMYSPLIHNAVEWGRALPMMPGKVLTMRVYFEGNAFKNDAEQMQQAIAHGLVPIGHRGGVQDITGIMEDPTIQPGRSWTAKALAAPVGLVSEKGATAVKKAVDKAGDVWHNTLLWDRIGDLQAGLYKNARDDFMQQGFDFDTAGRLAAHIANRYAGALPNEAMSTYSRKLANVILFSRSFTLGNIGVMKDMLTGMPQDVKAQILQNSGELALKKATTAAQKKALHAFAIDLAMMYVLNSTLQDALDHFKRDKSWGEIGQGYLNRLQAAMARVHENPLELASPFELTQSLFSNSENEPGKEGRIHFGNDDKGTAIYLRLPTGKIGEEFEGYLTSPLDMLKRKEGTIIRPIVQTFTNDRGFGRQVYDPEDKGITGAARNVGKIVWNLMSQQIPLDSLRAAYDSSTGHADDTDKLKALGPLFGLTFSKGAPGGPIVGEMFTSARRHENAVAGIMPDVHRALKLGEQDEAIRLMESVQMTPHEMAAVVRKDANPASRVSSAALRRFLEHANAEERDRMEKLTSR